VTDPDPHFGERPDVVIDPAGARVRTKAVAGISSVIGPAREHLPSLVRGAYLSVPNGYSTRIDMTTALAIRGGFDCVVMFRRWPRRNELVANDRWHVLVEDLPCHSFVMADSVQTAEQLWGATRGL
jgi:hypothetical protein